MTILDDTTRCGYVAVLGLPNAGKSTLINRMVGAKVTIVSHKVQTTRNRILGIFTKDQTQIILIDTPGLFQPSTRLDRAMVKAAWGGAEGADIILYLRDSQKPHPARGEDQILKRLSEIADKTQIYLVLNKVDMVEKATLLSLSQALHASCPFSKTFMISALKGHGVDDIVTDLSQNLPRGAWMYEDDQMSDLPMRLLAAEVTREQIFNHLHQELPYAITVETEEWENFDNGDVKLRQVIHVERESQKLIVVGKGGSTLKRIGMLARKEMETMLETKVHLNLFVRVSSGWRNDPAYYAQWGLEDS